uniref:MRN complex-interacting protein isoform X3 n=1 Tax=Monopterus albus TaxID=43700 RepID=UPI0009B414ED|nr:MRN complex-interacting protein isoform X3 [Monopterus albus]
MVQEFHILRCFKCQSFQVQQVKKMNRWICKLCGEKQSLVKEFGRGPGADCRRHVQKLNAMRGAKMEEQEANIWKRVGPDREEEAEAETGHQLGTPRQVKQAQVSRWSKYLDPPEEAEPWKEEKDVLMYRQKLHGNKITDRKRRGGWALEQSGLLLRGSSAWTQTCGLYVNVCTDPRGPEKILKSTLLQSETM